ncbi:Hypothetical_protein [Hexamita inflata]|uniref:Hypothetical_protein n=1 Tax=Hexamita inflata TaxID=28002 RepID=A0AA86QV22_9EUKA|nr:Hypothetical protein HINF_LOCUS48937 [Hexamita inflata]
MVSGLQSRLSSPSICQVRLEQPWQRAVVQILFFKLGVTLKIQFAELRFAARVFCLGVWPGRDCPRIYPVRAPPLNQASFCVRAISDKRTKIPISPFRRERENAARYVNCWRQRRQQYFVGAQLWMHASGNRPPFTVRILSSGRRTANAKMQRGVAERMFPLRLLTTMLSAEHFGRVGK